MSTADKLQVVIVGGGLAGHRIAYQLQSEAEVTLIDPKDFFENPIAAPRLFVEPGRSFDAIIPYDEFLPDVRCVIGRAEMIEPHRVHFRPAGNEETLMSIGYDYLILATGSNYPNEIVKANQGTTEERREHFHNINRELDAVKKVLIVGGGPVGVEIAGEITEEFTDKEISLVQNGSVLLPDASPGAQRYAERFLAKRGVKIHFDQRIVDFGTDNSQVIGSGTKVAVTDGGLSIPYDYLFNCFGYTHNTDYLRRHFSHVLDEDSRIKVDANLRVVGESGIFAAGDITSLSEPKLGINAGKHAAVIVYNLRKLLQSPSRKDLKTYAPTEGRSSMVVTLGRNHGVASLPFGDITFPWLIRKVKAKDMFIERYLKGIGLK